MNKTRKILSALISLAMLLSAFLITPLAAKATTNESYPDFKYVGLGDSISRGYGCYFEDSYPNLLGGYFRTTANHKNLTSEFYNLSQDGDRTDHLLGKLRNSKQYRDDVQNATVVTISMGGNNLMVELGRECAYALSIDPDVDLGYLDTVLKRVQEKPVSSTARITARLNSSAFKSHMNTMYNTFESELHDVCQEVRKLTNGQLVLQTIYKPTDFVIISNIIDSYMKQMNTLIVNVANSENATVADVYTAFKNYGVGDLTYVDVLGGVFDPHPTPTGQRIIYNTILPLVRESIDNMPEKTVTPQYLPQGDLMAHYTTLFNFESSSLQSDTSIFDYYDTAQNMISVGSTDGSKTDYDIKVVNTWDSHMLEYDMINNRDNTPITIKASSNMNGTSFLPPRGFIPQDSLTNGLMFQVDTTAYTGSRSLLIQFDEADSTYNSITRRGLRPNSEAYAQDADGNFTVPVTVNQYGYLILPQNYYGYIAMPFNSFRSVWSTPDDNFGIDLTQFKNLYIYKGSESGGGRLRFDAFRFYGDFFAENVAVPTYTPVPGKPTNLLPLFNGEDNRFMINESFVTNSDYAKRCNFYFHGGKIKDTPQYELKMVNNVVPDQPSTKSIYYETLPTQDASGQTMGISMADRPELNLAKHIKESGNFLSSSDMANGIAYYCDMTNYQSNDDVHLNLIWHEYESTRYGKHEYTTGSAGQHLDKMTSRNLNSSIGTITGVLDDNTEVSLTVQGDSVVIPSLVNGKRFKGWIKIPFGSMDTCWNNGDANGMVDLRDIYGIDFYFPSYPSYCGAMIFDEFSLYGPAFADYVDDYGVTPTPDVLNLQFNNNGTVTDAAGNATITNVNNVLISPITSVHKGITFTTPGMTVRNAGEGLVCSINCFEDSTALKNKLKMGFTMETFISKNSMSTEEEGIFSNTQNGGTGIYLANNKPYEVTATPYYKKTPTTDEITQGEFAHLLATYDGFTDTMSFYLNGKLISSKSFDGQFATAVGPAYNKFCLGGDVDENGNLSQLLSSEVKIISANIYSRAINGKEAAYCYAHAVNALSA